MLDLANLPEIKPEISRIWLIEFIKSCAMFVKLFLLALCFIASSGFVFSERVSSYRSGLKPLNAIITKDSNDLPSVIASNQADSGSSTVSSSVFNLAKCILGAGVLSLPSGIALFSDSKQAIVPAIGLLSFMGLASAYSFSSIGKACELHGVNTFADAYAKSFNVTSGYALSSVITFKTFFACLAYSIIIGKRYTCVYKG